MTDFVSCEYCKQSFPISVDRCPHCARPGLFPNVTLSRRSEERGALDARYRQALEECAKRDCRPVAEELEKACDESKAVIARSLAETHRMATGDHELYATFHQMSDIQMRIPDGEKWDLLRTLTDRALFGTYFKEVRFGALALDERGVSNYGECVWTLREDMIAHRASVFEENSVLFMEHQEIPISRSMEIPSGFRAPWEERGKLCVAKLGSKLTADQGPEDFPELLIENGETTADDDYVEVHIGGPISVRTIKEVRMTGKGGGALVESLREKLDRYGVEMKEKR